MYDFGTSKIRNIRTDIFRDNGNRIFDCGGYTQSLDMGINTRSSNNIYDLGVVVK